MRKVFVDVVVKYRRDGKQLPLAVIWEDGRKYGVDKVLEVKRAASLKAGGQGMRYRCLISGHEAFLWLEDGRWFVEAKR